MKFLKNFWPSLTWMAIIIYLSFTPLKDWPQPTIFQKLYFDKVVHVTMYSVLSFLLIRGAFLQQSKQPIRYPLFISLLLLAAGAGIVIEILQPILTQFRRFELADMIANAVGAATGALFFRLVASRRKVEMNV